MIDAIKLCKFLFYFLLPPPHCWLKSTFCDVCTRRWEGDEWCVKIRGIIHIIVEIFFFGKLKNYHLLFSSIFWKTAIASLILFFYRIYVHPDRKFKILSFTTFSYGTRWISQHTYYSIHYIDPIWLHFLKQSMPFILYSYLSISLSN